MLNVTMLQTPSVTLDGVPVSFPFKRADALLYYMLVRRSATRQELISLLWESCDEATGLKNLRNTLYTLKKTLGGDFLLSPQKSLVVVNSAWEVDCDYDRFTQQGDFSAYRGPFLQGFAVKHAFSFDEWLDRTREKLHGRYLSHLAQQAREAHEAGRAPCLRAVRQWTPRRRLPAWPPSICGRTPLTSPWPPSSWSACGRPGSTPGPPRCTSG